VSKQPVILIHGGSCWDSYKNYLSDLKKTGFDLMASPRPKWHEQLQKNLGPRFKVLLPEMPNWRNAHYLEWKIWYEKAVAIAGPNPIVIGHSLGAIFVVKYFAETARVGKTKGLLLVSAPYATAAKNPDFGDFALQRPPVRLANRVKPVCFYQSEDDPIVTAKNLLPYREFVPDAMVRTFKKRGHFVRGHFGELVRDIKFVAAGKALP
jgi:predicted alpha/beta hydrolase family esterase